jgi:hypothetical protein
MFGKSDLGASLYKTWSSTQRRDEIEKLVTGYRNGLPLGILCQMSEVIAGSKKRARKHLHAMLTTEERAAAIARETGGMKIVAIDFLE